MLTTFDWISLLFMAPVDSTIKGALNDNFMYES